jgi:hypothetical protein
MDILLVLMESNSTRRYKFINMEKKIKMDWSHTKKRRWGNTKGHLTMDPQGNRKRGRPKNSWRRSVIKKQVEAGMNLRFLAADRIGQKL